MERAQAKALGAEARGEQDASLSNLQAQSVEELLRTRAPQALERIPSELRSLTVVGHQVAKAHSGPLPVPEDIAEYNRNIPNGGDRIMALAERQQAHRIEIESLAVREQLKQSGRGQTFALALGATGLLGGIVCILAGHDWAGVSIVTGALVEMTTTFIWGKQQQKQDLEQKKAPLRRQPSAKPNRPTLSR